MRHDDPSGTIVFDNAVAYAEENTMLKTLLIVLLSYTESLIPAQTRPSHLNVVIKEAKSHLGVPNG